MSRFLALVRIFAESPAVDAVANELEGLGTLEEIYEVTGEFDLIALVSVTNIEEFTSLLKTKIRKMRGVRGTTSSIVLMDHRADEENGLLVPIQRQQR